MSPDPRGILVSISLKYGESFALPGVTAAAHILPPRARAMCSFANCFTLIVPYLALCQSRYLDMPNPAESTILVPRAAASPAIQPIISCSMKSSVCDMRRWYHDLPYGRSSPRRFRSPGCLGKCLASLQWNGPSSDFKTAAGTAETRLSLSLLGMSSSLRTKSAIFPIHST